MLCQQLRHFFLARHAGPAQLVAATSSPASIDYEGVSAFCLTGPSPRALPDSSSSPSSIDYLYSAAVDLAWPRLLGVLQLEGEHEPTRRQGLFIASPRRTAGAVARDGGQLINTDAAPRHVGPAATLAVTHKGMPEGACADLSHPSPLAGRLQLPPYPVLSRALAEPLESERRRPGRRAKTCLASSFCTSSRPTWRRSWPPR